MPTIQGKKVGNIGFGLMGMDVLNQPTSLDDGECANKKQPGLTWRPSKLSDDEIFAVIKAALDAGCNYFNGGEFYGPPDHNSLSVLKRYYDKYPEDVDNILLNVKGCMLPGLVGCASSPEGVRASIENSVSMIGGKGRIDQFEAARKDPNVDIEVTMKAMGEHVEAGDIGGIALSEVSAQTIRRAAKVAKLTAVEVELSIWNTDPLEDGVLEACAELEIPVIAYSMSFAHDCFCELSRLTRKLLQAHLERAS